MSAETQLPPETGKRRNLKTAFRIAFAFVCVVFAFYWAATHSPRRWKTSRADDVPKDPSFVLTTGYCNCGTCCSWKRRWFGFGDPVVSAGPDKGKPKRVGITAAGTAAHPGTLAADWKIYPKGTRLYVPGYGTGVVEDVGAAINGRHLDCWFPTHADARRWGRRWVKPVVVK